MLDHSWLLDDQKAAFAAAPFAANTTSVSSYLRAWLTENGYKSAQVKSGLYIQDAQITACLMNQALEFLQRALCNTVAHYILAKNGLETWACVTNYYASYFSVHGLLCLQGRTITRLQLGSTVQVQIVPVDLRGHIFGITTRHLGRNPRHETPWMRFSRFMIDTRFLTKLTSLLREKRTSRSPPMSLLKETRLTTHHLLVSPRQDLRSVRLASSDSGVTQLGSSVGTEQTGA